jgi:hypothetical protein
MSVREIINNTTKLIETKYLPTYGYGQFSYNSNVSLLGANVATPIPYDTTEIAQFCSFTSSSINILKAGVWKFAYSVQLDRTAGGTTHTDIWIKKNGINVPRSASRAVVQGANGETIIYCEYILSCNLNDTIQVYFASADTNIVCAYFAGSGTFPNDIPAVPSIITTLVQLS